jgi:hypothetical protein
MQPNTPRGIDVVDSISDTADPGSDEKVNTDRLNSELKFVKEQNAMDADPCYGRTECVLCVRKEEITRCFLNPRDPPRFGYSYLATC